MLLEGSKQLHLEQYLYAQEQVQTKKKPQRNVQ